ncbi:hypothetical protein [Photobacterium damselae]|uniref:hypothetical protein n=1 Tax=Photobacterium damselae TaxID=38293 RepID=UPI0040691343
MINKELSLLEKICENKLTEEQISLWNKLTTNMVNLGFKFELKFAPKAHLASISRTVDGKTQKMHTPEADKSFDLFCSMLPIIYIMEDRGAKLTETDCNELKKLLHEVCYSSGDPSQNSSFAIAINEFVSRNDGYFDDLSQLHKSYLDLIGVRDGIDYFAFDRALFSGFYDKNPENRIDPTTMLIILENFDCDFYKWLV